MRGQAVASTVLFTILLSACSGERSTTEPSGVSVFDSAGVTIIDNHDLDLEVSLLRVATPTLQIGVMEGSEEYQFFRVADIKRLSDGAIAVANAGSRELRIYEADGTHRVTAGGPGPGPSEFRYPAALVILPGDTIQVQDFMDRVYFAPDGAFLRRETADHQAFNAIWEAAGGSSEGGQWVPDGSFFAPIYHWNQSPPTPGPLYRPEMVLVRVSGDLSKVDTLGHFGGILQQYVEVGGRWGVSSIVPPFSANSSWAIGSGDGTIVVGDNAAPQIDRFHPGGAHSVVRWTAHEDAITEAEIEEWKEQQRSAEWTQGQLPELERGWAAMDVPKAKAFYGRVTAGSDGTLWVGEIGYSETSTRLMAFDVRGHYAGTVSIPGSFTPHDSGPGWLVGLVRDENGVEYVQLFPLENG